MNHFSVKQQRTQICGFWRNRHSVRMAPLRNERFMPFCLLFHWGFRGFSEPLQSAPIPQSGHSLVGRFVRSPVTGAGQSQRPVSIPEQPKAEVVHLHCNPLIPFDRIRPTVVHPTPYFIRVLAVSWSPLRAATFLFLVCFNNLRDGVRPVCTYFCTQLFLPAGLVKSASAKDRINRGTMWPPIFASSISFRASA